jgi:SAM-dependent methyltransferase
MQSEDEAWVPDPGESTAYEQNVLYRTGKISEYARGHWLDYGCADGGYAAGLLHVGAHHVTGVDVDPDRVAAAVARGLEHAEFETIDGDRLPFEDDTFDGAFVNEVMEHVQDESAVLHELRRVLRPDGLLVVMSPNRWFPFEGHGIQVGKWKSRRPTPLVPWLPRRVSQPMMEARNYWPHELEDLVRSAGFTLVRTGFVWPVFERYDWLPERVGNWYRDRVTRFDEVPALRRLGVSTMIVARA